MKTQTISTPQNLLPALWLFRYTFAVLAMFIPGYIGLAINFA